MSNATINIINSDYSRARSFTSLPGYRKSLSAEVSTTGIFSASTLTLIFYLLGMRYHSYAPTPLFFISIGLMIGSITYQCLALKLSPRFAGIVLLEISISALVFHLIYQIPGYGLLGSDAYQDMASLKGILESGFIRGVPDYIQLTGYFPMIHILGAQLYLITGIDSFAVAKWFPSLIGIAIIPLLYLYVKHIFKNEKAALLSALLFATLQHHAIFSSLFVRETIALVLALSCIYLYISAKSSRHPVAYRSLSILCLAGTVFAHHLTSLMLILFLIIHWLVTSVFKFPALRRWYSNNEFIVENISLSFVLIAVIGTFTYWMITATEPVQILITFAKNLITPSVWGTNTYSELTNLAGSLPTVRYVFLIYGSYICYFIFGLFLLYRLLPRAGERYLETYSSTIYLVVCGVGGIVSFFLVPQTVAGDRFLAFGWLFAFGPLALTVIEHKHRWAMRIGMVLIVFFMFLNMYTIHPTVWDPQAKGSGGTPSQEDFALAKTLGFSEGPILSNLNNLMPIYYEQNNPGIDAFALSGPVDLKDFNWIIINRKGFEEEGLYSRYTLTALSDMQSLESEGSIIYNKNYESNNIAVFKRR